MRIGYLFGERLVKSGAGNTHLAEIVAGLHKLGHRLWIYGPAYGFALPRRVAGAEAVSMPLGPRCHFTAGLFYLLSLLYVPLLLAFRRPEATRPRTWKPGK